VTSIFVELDEDDLVQLEHLARATGQPRARPALAGTLIRGALAADRRTDPATSRRSES
jgi:hypothetical protein